jgi:WD40 repeat protein
MRGDSDDVPNAIWLTDVSRPVNGNNPNSYPADAIAWQPGTGRFALSGESGVQLVDPNTHAVLWQQANGNNGSPWPFTFSPDGRRIVGARGPNVVVYDAATGEELMALREFEEQISALAFSHNGHMLIVGAKDDSVRCYNGTPLIRTPPGPVGPAELSNRAVAILTGEVRGISGWSKGSDKTHDLSVRVERIQKDEMDEFVPNESVTIRFNGKQALPRLLGYRARFYLAKKSDEVWTLVDSDNGMVRLGDDAGPFRVH